MFRLHRPRSGFSFLATPDGIVLHGELENLCAYHLNLNCPF